MSTKFDKMVARGRGGLVGEMEGLLLELEQHEIVDKGLSASFRAEAKGLETDAQVITICRDYAMRYSPDLIGLKRGAPTLDRDRLASAMHQLESAERERYEAVLELKELGAIRTESVVGEIGELMAMNFYGELAARTPSSNPGYDIVLSGGHRIQVKTLRSSPSYERTSIGRVGEAYDVLLVIRLNAQYEPTEVIAAPRSAVEELFSGQRVEWTRALGNHPRVRHLDPSHFRLF